MRRAALALGAALAAAGCAAPSSGPQLQVEPISSTLPPGEMREPRVGDTHVWRTADGRRLEETLRAREGDLFHFESGLHPGCAGLTGGHPFAPAAVYRNCPDGTLTLEIEKNGALFPMTVGADAAWRVDGRWDDGRAFSDLRYCLVERTERVTVPAGSFDAYVVGCDEGSRRLVYHYAPSIGVSVAFRRTSSRQGDLAAELVSFTPGA